MVACALYSCPQIYIIKQEVPRGGITMFLGAARTMLKIGKTIEESGNFASTWRSAWSLTH